MLARTDARQRRARAPGEGWPRAPRLAPVAAATTKTGADAAARAQLAEYPLYVKANIYRERGNITESLMLFQKAARLNPHNVDNMKQVLLSAPNACRVLPLNPA